jgi:hypothetical protein
MKTALQAAAKIFGKSNFRADETPGFLFETKYKIVVFIPLQNADELTFAMASSGAGIIGNYSVCSFRTKGTGTFRGEKNSKPAAGRKGKFEQVEEIKLEMLCSLQDLAEVTRSVYEVHPYEEPAIEVYELMAPLSTASKELVSVELKKPVPLKDIVSRLNSAIESSVFPNVPGSMKIKHAVIDLTENSCVSYYGFKKNTLLIKSKRNITIIEIL